MTQAMAAPAAAPAASAPPVPAAPLPVHRREENAAPSQTPRQLRLLSTGVWWLGVAFGVAGAVSFLLLALALNRAGDSTAQLIRVQQIQTSVLAADANATNAFLVGGLEPATQRTAYDRALDSASVLIAQAARAEPADQAALSALNEQLVTYAAGIEQARANNRQGFPVGAQYLKVASSTLRAQALPVLDNLVRANAARASGQMDTNEAWLFGVVGLLAVAGLIAAQVWLARRFRRTVNPLLLAGSGAALATWLALMVVTANVADRVEGVRTDTYARVNAAATARIAGFDAKSNESLTLIARGSGAAFEKAWQASAATASSRFADLPSQVGSTWQAYAAVHRQIRALDDGGTWDQAVELATTNSAAGTSATTHGSANSTFAAFDAAASSVVSEDGTQATGVLRGQEALLIGVAVAAFLVGIAAGVLSRRGVLARLQEYR